MSVRKLTFVPGEYYHIYNRGNSKQQIFKTQRDYDRFLGLLYGTNTSDHFNYYNDMEQKDVFRYAQENPPVAIGAYCLMPNHFHILLTPTRVGGVSEFMQKLSTAYPMYFNLKYRRSGSLFEGKFKAEHVNEDRYLKYLFSYIHLNPVKLLQKDWKEVGIHDKQKALDFLQKYKYSSYIDYVGKMRKEQAILNKAEFPDYFRKVGSIQKEMFTWVSYKTKV